MSPPLSLTDARSSNPRVKFAPVARVEPYMRHNRGAPLYPPRGVFGERGAEGTPQYYLPDGFH